MVHNVGVPSVGKVLFKIMTCLCSCRLSYSSNCDMIYYSVILCIFLALLHVILKFIVASY